MRYVALASDFDGTLASNGHVHEATLTALRQVRESGRKLILITGRELDDLLQIFAEIDLFERVIAENGALLYRPGIQEEKVLGEAPPEELVLALRKRNIAPLSIGRVIIATWHPNETIVLEAIRDLGLERQVIFNKGAVMVLPAGVNKASGLHAALEELGLSPHNVVGIGDAENDHAFLALSECAVAVANALPMVKERADIVTLAVAGSGVIEIANGLVEDDLRSLDDDLSRHDLTIGTHSDGREVKLRPHGVSVLIAGTSGSGKSTLATGIVEQIAEQSYQFCLIDPEGDYESFADAAVLGNSERAPSIDEILQFLQDPGRNLIVNLLGCPLGDRPTFFADLLPRLQALRALAGRPHWVVVDEAHHLMPAKWNPASIMLPQDAGGLLLITVHPNLVAPPLLDAVDVFLLVGDGATEILRETADIVGERIPPMELLNGPSHGVAAWMRRSKELPFRMSPVAPRTERRRHRRKYATGDVGHEKSFYFRGPDNRLNLRAQNLILFMQLAEGVDDATWLHHFQQGDYSRWFREAIKDDGLADEAAEIERDGAASVEENRKRIAGAIERRYTLPA